MRGSTWLVSIGGALVLCLLVAVSAHAQPVAEAGQDVTVTCAGPDGAEVAGIGDAVDQGQPVASCEARCRKVRVRTFLRGTRLV